MSKPILNAPTPDQLKLDILRQHFPQAVQTDAQGRIRINAGALQLAVDPSNPAGIAVEEDGYELRWVGKREAYHSAFIPVQKILSPLPDESKHWDATGNLLLAKDLLRDEVFRQGNHLGDFVWRRTASSALADRRVSSDYEYVLAYHQGEFSSLGIPKDYKNFSNLDGDPRGEWVSGDLTVGMGADERPNQFYDLVDPKTGKCYRPNRNRVWSYIPESMNKLIAEGRILFPSDITRRPMLKRFKKDLKSDANPMSTWLADVGLNTEATKDIQNHFQSNIFDYSKPLPLINHLIQTSTSGEDTICDFFARSGTTAEALMRLNAEET